MRVGNYCKRTVVSIDGTVDVLQAARRMREQHVGFLVVHKEGDDLRRPIGVMTDRDLVIGVMARGVDPQSVTVQDVMTVQPQIASENDSLTGTLQAMRLAGVRRVPVVDDRGALTGIIAIDDALEVITGLMCAIGGTITSEQRHERRVREG